MLPATLVMAHRDSPQSRISTRSFQWILTGPAGGLWNRTPGVPVEMKYGLSPGFHCPKGNWQSCLVQKPWMFQSCLCHGIPGCSPYLPGCDYLESLALVATSLSPALPSCYIALLVIPCSKPRFPAFLQARRERHTSSFTGPWAHLTQIGET